MRDHVDFFGTTPIFSKWFEENEVTNPSTEGAEEVLESRARIGFETVEVDAGIADTDAERIQGLSGRPALGEREGLFFVFTRPGMHGIWMKEMRFPIDIIWFDEQMQVVGLKERATPESFPEVYLPSMPALYVLEVNAGFAEMYGIEEGETASFSVDEHR
jgi:uncharacterized membrane protein (UPF0127 family)